MLLQERIHVWCQEGCEDLGLEEGGWRVQQAGTRLWHCPAQPLGLVPWASAPVYAVGSVGSLVGGVGGMGGQGLFCFQKFS